MRCCSSQDHLPVGHLAACSVTASADHRRPTAASYCSSAHRKDLSESRVSAQNGNQPATRGFAASGPNRVGKNNTETLSCIRKKSTSSDCPAALMRSVVLAHALRYQEPGPGPYSMEQPRRCSYWRPCPVFADSSAPASYVSDREQKESGSQRLEADALRMKDPPWGERRDLCAGELDAVVELFVGWRSWAGVARE